MRWLGVLVVGAVSNLDNLGVGVALGLRGTRVGARANMIVAGTTMAATAAAVTCGHVLSQLLPSAVTGWLGPLIIIAIGAATALSSAQVPGAPGRGPARSKACPYPGGVDRAVSWRRAIMLGAALSANNLGTGVGAGISGIPALATAGAAGLLSLVCVGGGSDMGRAFRRLGFGRHAPLLAGMLLLAVGAAMLLCAR